MAEPLVPGPSRPEAEIAIAKFKKHKLPGSDEIPKNKNIRDLYTGINEFKRDYQPRNNLVKDKNGDQTDADSHNILNRWKNYFSHLLNVHNVSEVRQLEVHTAQPLVPGPSS
jgi:hypothetical protein